MGENKVSITRLDQFYTHCKSDSSLREMIRINLTVKYFECENLLFGVTQKAGGQWVKL